MLQSPIVSAAIIDYEYALKTFPYYWNIIDDGEYLVKGVYTGREQYIERLNLCMSMIMLLQHQFLLVMQR